METTRPPERRRETPTIDERNQTADAPPDSARVDPDNQLPTNADARDGTQPKSRRWLWIVGGLGIVLVGLLAFTVWARLRQNHELHDAAAAVKNAQPLVNVAPARRAQAQTELLLPGNSQAVQETAIYARTNGYLKRWLVDIGDPAEPGQLLAEIETPEVDRELEQARAALVQARAALTQARADTTLARVSLQRLQRARAEAVARQQVDEAQGAFDAATARVEAAQANIKVQEANVKRLEELQSFQKVTAPFAGVITARNVDRGALITAGSSGNGRELFRIAQRDTLRVFVSVPQSFALLVQPGQKADILVREYPDRAFPGKVTRTAGALDQNFRTLLTEVRVPNQDNTLLPGMYVQVKFMLQRAEPPVIVPAAALLTGPEGPRVATVANDTVQYRGVQVGRDYGTEIEIVSGLAGAETLVLNPGANLAEGMAVQAVAAQDQQGQQTTNTQPQDKTVDEGKQ